MDEKLKGQIDLAISLSINASGLKNPDEDKIIRAQLKIALNREPTETEVKEMKEYRRAKNIFTGL